MIIIQKKINDNTDKKYKELLKLKIEIQDIITGCALFWDYFLGRLLIQFYFCVLFQLFFMLFIQFVLVLFSAFVTHNLPPIRTLIKYTQAHVK